MQKDESIKYKFSQPMDKTNLLSDYIQCNLLAFQHLRNRNYNSAKKSFKECINLAKQLNDNDESKHLESLVNYAISQYFCGKFLDSYSSLERAYQISNRILSRVNNDKNILNLHIRILANISLIALSLNKINECKLFFSNIIDIIEKEVHITTKIFLFKEVIYIFFRIESLNNFYEENIVHNEILNSPSKKNEINEINLNNINKAFESEKNIINLHKDQIEAEEEEIFKNKISKTLLSLHKFLRENDIETWIRCLVEESNYFKNKKDVNGYVFTIINQYAANYYQSGKVGDFKNIYPTIINNYGERAKEKLKDKSPEKILIEMKSRIETAVDIYRKLVETENDLFNLFDKYKEEKNKINSNDYYESIQNEKNSNKFLIKLFFKHALYQLSKESNNNNLNLNKKIINENNKNLNNKNDFNSNNKDKEDEIVLKNKEINRVNNDDNNNLENNSGSYIRLQIEQALKLLENDEFDISSINVFNINSEITKSLKILFENIKIIRTKKEMHVYFKKWKIGALGYEKLGDQMQIRYGKNKIYFKKLLEEIIKGDEITKIHFSSNGKIVHFYQLDSDSLNLKVYKNIAAKSGANKFKSIPLSEIKEVLYGQNSENLIKRFKNLINKELKQPWLFISFILNKRSIDLFFDSKEKLNKWFYGLKYLIEEKYLKIKIKSTIEYVLTRMKLRMITELKELTDNDIGNQHKSLLVLTQLRNFAQTNYFGFENLSFLKVLLLYVKVKKIKTNN